MYIKYRYALDQNGCIVDVGDLTEADRRDYECLACGNVLRPVMGEVRRKHFRHQVQVDVACSEETYLHQLGKRMFLQVYRRCLEAGEPFEIEISRAWFCTLCKKFGPCQIGQEPVRYDLTAYFTDIVLETPDDGFIPDVMLSNESGERVYVEIAVTHASTEKKREAGLRIIELSVENEADLEIIETRLLPETDERVDLIEFRTKPVRGEFPDECVKTRGVLSVWPSGEVHYETKKTVGALRNEALDEDKRFYFAFVLFGVRQIYIEAVERAYLIGLKVRNCSLCQHRDLQSLHPRTAPHRIYCTFWETPVPLGQAVDCGHYSPDAAAMRIYWGGEIGQDILESNPVYCSRGMAALLKREGHPGRRGLILEADEAWHGGQ